jgi:hypothetical protein
MKKTALIEVVCERTAGSLTIIGGFVFCSELGVWRERTSNVRRATHLTPTVKSRSAFCMCANVGSTDLVTLNERAISIFFQKP